MKILLLHGWGSTPGGVKPTFLRNNGHEVCNPPLPDDDFDAAVRIAQAHFDQQRPEVVVGASRGGAVAMNLDTGAAPLVLLCPAWKRWGAAITLKPQTVILHAAADEAIPIAESRELLKNSGLPEAVLLVVGTEHRLADPEALQAMLKAVERVARGERCCGDESCSPVAATGQESSSPATVSRDLRLVH
jgi:alpha-beta hydrolase superfamily lysophospholipase